MKQEDKEKDHPGRRDSGAFKSTERRKCPFYPQKMANDPKLLQAFSQQFAICKQDITHIPAKYMELMLMLMGCCAGNSVTIKTHGELAVKRALPWMKSAKCSVWYSFITVRLPLSRQ